MTAADRARIWVERTTRVGFAAKSVVYLVVAVLCGQAALSPVREASGPLGAVATIARAPPGVVLLVVSVPGFAAYCLWRMGEAIFDTTGLGRGIVGIVGRIGGFVTGLVYGGLTVMVIREIVGIDAPTFGGFRGLFQQVLLHPAGRVLVGLAGLVMAGVALVQLVRAVTASFRDTFHREAMSPWFRRTVDVLGRIAFGLWGTLFGVMAWLGLEAALTARATEASLGGAIRTVEEQPWQPWPLGLVALGFLAFSAYAAVEVRWRRIRAA